MTPSRTRYSSLLAMALALVMIASSLGCATESISRNVNYSHWHDDETIIFVYKRDVAAGSMVSFFRLQPITTHVLVCKVGEDNGVRCKEQRQIANMLNPHAVDRMEISDPWQP